MGYRIIQTRILFVHNADSGSIEGLRDHLHKTTSPSTYQCRLCGITYGNLGMRGVWKDFLDTRPCPNEFMHRDEFRGLFGSRDDRLPVAFLIIDDSIRSLLSSDDINETEDLEALIDLVRGALDEVMEGD